MEYKNFKNFLVENHKQLFESGKDSKEINEIILNSLFSKKDHNPKTRDLIRKYKSRYLKFHSDLTEPQEPIKLPTEKKDSIESILEMFEKQQKQIDSLKQTLDSILDKNDGTVNTVNNDIDLINSINEFTTKETKRETFHINIELVDKINSFYVEKRVNKSSLLNYIISQFFENLK